MRIITVLVLLVLAGCGAGHITPLATGAGPGSAEPHLAVAPDGTAVLSFIEPTARGAALRYSTLGESGWSSAITLASGDDWFVNWADFPSVEPLTETRWAAHWLVKVDGGNYAYNAVVAVSEDGGASWSEPTLLHTDGTATEHGFVSLYPATSGVGAVWLDGRGMTGDHASATSASNSDTDGAVTGMQLRTAVLQNRSLHKEAVVDNLVCDCCQTDVAVTQNGPVAVYRNRTRNEIRDIYVARHTVDGWQPGVPLASDGWRIDGCPVNGPAIAASGSKVAVAWYTEAQIELRKNNRVQLVFSSDSGQSFGAPVETDAIDPVGRVDVAILADGSTVVSWVERGVGELRAQHFDGTDLVENPMLITPIETNRGAGFPQMVAVGQGLLFAWTDTSEDQSLVRSLLVRL